MFDELKDGLFRIIREYERGDRTAERAMEIISFQFREFCQQGAELQGPMKDLGITIRKWDDSDLPADEAMMKIACLCRQW
ncbi:hypothetical protein [Geobacter grbiciae]|uniref:hypothetical protein n=1 Tax=Geobacter grbiciae TaxID=155042 RepID=UPI001C036A25|nr:hypothetical protein [Geobacter grbiciae]MBT1077302.1 hypothetical protein [Geobacter grbiciae]